MQVKAGHTVSHDFEPIIIEEVFYNGKIADFEQRNAMNLVSPNVIFDRVR